MASRRTFIEVDEIPGLIEGALSGDRRALRRILGGRRGGRYGALLLVGAGLLAAPLDRLPLLAVVYLATGAVAWRVQRRDPRLSPREVLRAGQWTSVGFVALAIPLRLVLWPESAIPAALALVAGYALLLRWLARGLD